MARLSPEEYARDLGFGWTVTMALAHLAYWGERNALMLARWQHEGYVPEIDSGLVNDTALPLFRALPWHAVRNGVIRAAEEADRAAAAVSLDLAAQIIAGSRKRMLNRNLHQREHRGDIEVLWPANGGHFAAA